MDAHETSGLARHMLQLANRAATAPPISEVLPGFTSEDAYAVSAEGLRLREAGGWKRVGRKIGFTNRTIYHQYGVYEPILGYMYDKTVSYAEAGDGRAKATVDLSPLCQPLFEPEIVFKLRLAPVSDEPAALLEAVDWIAHGCELVQCHFPDWKFTVADTIADAGLHGCYVVGPPLMLDDALRASLPSALETFTATGYRDGEKQATGGGSLVLDSPLNTLAWLVQALRRLPDHPALEAGEIVTTGTLTSALPPKAGEVWTTSIGGLELPGLEIRFV